MKKYFGKNKTLVFILVILLICLSVTALYGCKENGEPSAEPINPAESTEPTKPAESTEPTNPAGTEEPTDTNNYFTIVYGIDSLNESDMSKWVSMPLVSQSLLDAGFKGGESCQRLAGLARSETNPDLMFLGTDVGGLFKSADGGRSWEQCCKGLDRRGVGQIAIDPKNSSHIVVTNTASGEKSSKYFSSVYYSFDEGETWTASENTDFLGISAAHYYYNTLAFDENSYDEALGYCTEVYYSTPYERDPDPNTHTPEKAGLYKSEDGGVSFSKYESSLPLYDGMMVVCDGKVYLGNQVGLFVETDDGFIQKNDLCIETFKKVGDMFYILTEKGIFVADDKLDFQMIECQKFPDIKPRNLEVSGIDPDYMVLSARKRNADYSDRIYVTDNGGSTWTLVDLGKENIPGMFFNFTWGVTTYSFNNTVPGEIVGTTSNTIIRSSDYGKTWRVSCDGIANVMVGGKFHFNVYNPDLVYMGLQDFGGAITTDGGKTWTSASLSKDGNGRNIYGGYAADENTIIGVYTEQWANSTHRTNERYVCFSHDGGKTVNIVKEDLEDPDKQEMLKSINICPKILTSYESSYQSPNDKNVLFCGNYRSTDNGYTWENMLDYETPCLQVYTHCGKTLYGVALNEGTVLKSDDDGKTWLKVNENPLPKKSGTQSNHIIDIAVDGKNGYVYAIYDKRLYRMKSDGTEAKDLTGSMSKDNWKTVLFNSVAVDPTHPEIVYCGGSGDMYLSSRGIRRSCDCGETWQTVTTSGVEDSIVTGGSYGYETKCLRVNPLTGELWNGTSCLGFSKLTPPYDSPCYDGIKTVKILFYLGYDNKVGVAETKVGRKILEPENPTREGYEFLGWITEDGENYLFGQTALEDLHLYAKWKEIE